MKDSFTMIDSLYNLKSMTNLRSDGKFQFTNFLPFDMPYIKDGISYSTPEHAFQAAKVKFRKEKLSIASAANPSKAKAIGRKVELRQEWRDISYRYNIMKDILRYKFRDGTGWHDGLMLTHHNIIVEWNRHNDNIWGVDIKNDNFLKKNIYYYDENDIVNTYGVGLLGKCLMEIRYESNDKHLFDDYYYSPSLNTYQYNILNIIEGIVIHQCNAKGVMGAGVAMQLRTKYPELYTVYKNSDLKLGNISIYNHTDYLYIVNCIMQDNYGRERCYTDLHAVKTCMMRVHALSQDLGLQVYAPYNMGCGLAGGDWYIVKQLVELYCPEIIWCVM